MAPPYLGFCFQGPLRPLIPQLKKLVFYAAFHSSNIYSTPFDPFSYWSEQGNITPWDNKSTKGQEVRLTPVTFGLTRFPSTICLWLTMPHPSPGPEEISAAKNNSTNQHRSDPEIRLSRSVSHPGSSQPWKLAMLSLTAANVLLRLQPT